MLDKIISELEGSNVPSPLINANHKHMQGERYVKKSYDDSTPNLHEYYSVFSAKHKAKAHDTQSPIITLDSSMRCRSTVDGSSPLYSLAIDGCLIDGPGKSVQWSRAELVKYRIPQ